LELLLIAGGHKARPLKMVDQTRFRMDTNYDTFIGYRAGAPNTTGSRNVFLGHFAGFRETGSNRLYIDDCCMGSPCNAPFIFGEFDTRKLRLDGSLGIGIRPLYGVDVSGGGISKSQLHFSLAGTDTGGWVTSNGENNFFLSSWAVWDEVNGGWVQKSADLKAVVAGSGAMGYRVMMRSNCPVGTVCDTTTRMHLKYNGTKLITVAAAGMGGDEVIDHVHGDGEENLDVGIARGGGDAFGQEGLSGAGISDQDHIHAVTDELE
jgi:hypothetical protein